MSRPTWTRVASGARKFGVALLGLLGVLAVVLSSSAGLLPEPIARWAPVVVALATALGVYRAPNADTFGPTHMDGARRNFYALGRLDQASGQPHRFGTSAADLEAATGPEPSVWMRRPERKGPSHL